MSLHFDAKRSRALLEGEEPGTAEGVAQIDSNECISFHLVSPLDYDATLEKLEGQAEGFGPIMSHQLYGDEQIVGYKDPKVRVYLSPLFSPFIVASYESKGPITEPEDLMKPMEEAFSYSRETTLQNFASIMQEEGMPGTLTDLGDLVLTKKIGQEEDSEILEIYTSNLSSASANVKKIHERMEPLLLFFIDAASAIDATDPSWELLLCLIRSKDGSIRIVGMSTIYVFYVYPDKKRFRLSQAFVLPPEQGKGIGSAIVDAVFDLAEKNKNVVDITLEDPTDDFRRIRDRRDLKAIISMDWVTSEALNKLEQLGGQREATPESPLAPTQETISKLCNELMMNKKQAERMWESLLFKISSEMGSEKMTAVEGYISKTLEDSFVGGAKDDSESKIVVDTPTGFVMYKSKTKVALGTGNIPPVEDITGEQQREMIASYVAGRVEEIKALVGIPTE